MPTSLTIPAQYVDDFRAAVGREISDDLEYIEDAYNENWLPIERRREDVDAAYANFARDHDLYNQIISDQAGDSLTVRQDSAVLGMALHRMAEAVASRLTEGPLQIMPLDGEQAAQVRVLTCRLLWAVDNAAEAEADRISEESC